MRTYALPPLIRSSRTASGSAKPGDQAKFLRTTLRLRARSATFPAVSARSGCLGATTRAAKQRGNADVTKGFLRADPRLESNHGNVRVGRRSFAKRPQRCEVSIKRFEDRDARFGFGVAGCVHARDPNHPRAFPVLG